MSNETRLFWILTISTIVWIILMRPFTPTNIVEFEFAKTVDHAQLIISNWGAEGVTKAQLSIYLDFVFLVLYSWAISLGCKVVVVSHYLGWLKKTGEYLSTIIWFAGSCDLMENVAMLITLSGMNEFSVTAAYYFAMVKFAIVLVCLLFIIITPVMKVMAKRR
jgi:hypothetical protein